eukprot:TRINITY_DN19243_c0_g1_i2.p1 TRINITY_DN19243_c0_g1~~TRINITY_DN19243_c0_g1_i2.p1  ORF type:complete len:378 (+),score=81.68 TRINITY_DN19243_c0_g1_i2:1169-2302(+)
MELRVDVGDRTVLVLIGMGTTCGDIKNEVASELGVEESHIELSFGGVVLKDHKPVIDYGVTADSEIVLQKTKKGFAVEQLFSAGLPLSTDGLIEAVRSDSEMVSYYLDALGGESVNSRCSSSKATPLLIAANQGNTAAVEVLLSYGGNPNLCISNNITPLLAAALKGHTKCVEALLTSPAIIVDNLRECDDWSPLHCAASSGHLPTTLLLLRNRANVNAVDKQGSTPLFYAAVNNSISCNNIELIELLLDNNADTTLADDKGWTPLHCCVVDDDCSEAVDMLLRYGADANIQDNVGCSPLHGAAVAGAVSNASILLEFGADVHMTDSIGWAPLHCAPCSSSSIEMCKLLLSNGADINAVDDKGCTVLHIVCESKGQE